MPSSRWTGNLRKLKAAIAANDLKNVDVIAAAASFLSERFLYALVNINGHCRTFCGVLWGFHRDREVEST